MTAMILDERMTERLIAERRRLGLDNHDEVWDGVYVMSPSPTNDHQDVVSDFVSLFRKVIPRPSRVQPGANVSDRAAGWEHSFRVPDVVVVLPGCPAVDHGTHWQGGPDFLVEVRSPGDDTFRKLDFYAGVGVRELLVVDRDGRTPQLFRLGRTRLSRVRPALLDGQPWLISQVLPLAFARGVSKGKPRPLVRRTAGAARTWKV